MQEKDIETYQKMRGHTNRRNVSKDTHRIKRTEYRSSNLAK